MRKFIKMILVSFAVLLLFPLAACGGEKLANIRELDKAFEDTAAELNKADLNLTFKVNVNLKANNGDNSMSLSSKEKTVFAERKIKQGDRYFEHTANSLGAAVWFSYSKKEGKYERAQTSLNNVPRPSDSYTGFALSFFLSEADDNFDVFFFKGGKYVLNLDKYLELNKADDFIKGKDKMAAEISFKNGKISRMYFYQYEFLTNAELKIEVIYKFGGASVKLPSVVEPSA